MSVHCMPIEQALAGMVLAEAVRDASGAVLLAAGATLTDAMLNALRRRGIAFVGILAAVESEDDNGAPIDNGAHERASDAERTRQCERLAHLFRHSAVLGATGALLERLMHYRKTH